MVRQRAPRRLAGYSLGLVVVMLLSGCAAVQIRTASHEGGPLRVGSQHTQGPVASQDPTPTEDPIPEGMKEQQLKFGKKCPLTVTLATPDNWNNASGFDSFQSIGGPGSGPESPTISMSCTEAYSDNAVETINARRDYKFSSESGSELKNDRKGQFKSGYYWSYQGELGADEILAISQQPTASYGFVVSLKMQGKLYTFDFEARAIAADAPACDDIEAIMKTVRLEGERVPLPPWK